MFAKVLLTYLCIFEVVLINTSVFCHAKVGNRRIDDDDITGDTKDSLKIAAESFENRKACPRKQNNLLHEVRVAKPDEFPFIAAFMSAQNELLCSGVVVSNGMVLTSSLCSSQPIGYVLLNTTDGKKENHVPLRVLKTEKYPKPAGGEERNVALVYTEKHNTVASKIELSSLTDQKAIRDFEAIGFGLNSEVGQPKVLQYVGLENRGLEAGDHIKGYLDCIDTKVPTCFKDFGGPAVVDNELVGVVTDGRDSCLAEITSQFANNDKIVDVLPIYVFKPWLEEQIKKNEKPVLRESRHMLTGAKAGGTKIEIGVPMLVTLLISSVLTYAS